MNVNVIFFCSIKMAVVKHAFFIALLLVICFRVRKAAFVSSGCLYLSHDDEDSSRLGETYILSSLWQSRGGRFNFAVRCSNSTLLGLLLLLCGDVELARDQFKIPDFTRSWKDLLPKKESGYFTKMCVACRQILTILLSC